jgi:8-oxo-dGTP diphosphatase
MKQAAIGIIFNAENNSVLLIKRRDVPVWALPGGGIEINETPETACAREVLEETGLTVICTKKVGTWLPINRLASPTHVYECTPTQMDNILLPQEESKEVRFWPLEKLPKTLFFVHKEWITEALANNSVPILATLDNLTYFTALKLIFQHPILSIRYILSRLGCPINL